MSTFRQLVQEAMYELRDEILKKTSAKLESLLRSPSTTTAPLPQAPAGARVKKATIPVVRIKPPAIAPAAKPKGAKKGAGRPGRPRSRGAGVDLGGLQAKVLKAMGSQQLRRSEIAKAAGLTASEDARLGELLSKLRTDGKVKMRGTRGSARYEAT